MINSVGDSNNRLIAPINDFPRQKDPSHEKGGAHQINVYLSEEAQELKMFNGDSLLTKVLKKEFNEIFELGGEKKGSFLKKLDHIFANNRQ